MRIKKLIILATMTCLVLSMVSFPALAGVTQSANGLYLSNDDAREIIADNAALLAEIEAVRQALATERKSTEELIHEMNSYVAATKEKETLLTKQIELSQKQAKAERQRGLGRIFLGLLIGGAVGAIATR